MSSSSDTLSIVAHDDPQLIDSQFMRTLLAFPVTFKTVSTCLFYTEIRLPRLASPTSHRLPHFQTGRTPSSPCRSSSLVELKAIPKEIKGNKYGARCASSLIVSTSCVPFYPSHLQPDTCMDALAFCSSLVECSLSRLAFAVASDWVTVVVLRSIFSGVLYTRLPIASQYVVFMRVTSLGTNGKLSFK